MKLLRRLIDRYPYRGLFGWATACVWGFVIAETLWHLSAYVRNYDILEIPLVVPYAPLAAILDPHDAMIPDKNIFFFALANWLVIFLIGAAVSVWRRVGTRLTGSATLLVVLVIALGRAYVFWLTHRHIYME